MADNIRQLQYWQGAKDFDEFVVVVDCPEAEYEILAEEWKEDGCTLRASMLITQDVTIWPTNRPLIQD